MLWLVDHLFLHDYNNVNESCISCNWRERWYNYEQYKYYNQYQKTLP